MFTHYGGAAGNRGLDEQGLFIDTWDTIKNFPEMVNCMLYEKMREEWLHKIYKHYTYVFVFFCMSVPVTQPYLTGTTPKQRSGARLLQSGQSPLLQMQLTPTVEPLRLLQSMQEKVEKRQQIK
jgi:hypothetical protein